MKRRSLFSLVKHPAIVRTFVETVPRLFSPFFFSLSTEEPRFPRLSMPNYRWQGVSRRTKSPRPCGAKRHPVSGKRLNGRCICNDVLRFRGNSIWRGDKRTGHDTIPSRWSNEGGVIFQEDVHEWRTNEGNYRNFFYPRVSIFSLCLSNRRLPPPTYILGRNCAWRRGRIYIYAITALNLLGGGET